jgi:hypothetical protein
MPTTSEPIQEIVLADFIRKLRVPPGYVAPIELTYDDPVWHEVEFRDGTSFTYAVFDDDGGYLGCCYLYPMGGRTTLSERLLRYDVDVPAPLARRAFPVRGAVLLQHRDPARLGV